MSKNIEDIKQTIAKLLAKAERTDNEHERDTFNAAAERMMLRLGIERAELESAGEVRPEEIVEESRVWRGNYAIVMVPFFANVARGFSNLTCLQSKSTNWMIRFSYVIGHKSDVEEFLRLMDSLQLQAMSALKRWQKATREERRGYTDMQKYTGNRSFLEAFGIAVFHRLQEERRDEEATATPGAALVLASKMDRVDAWKDDKYGGNLRTSRTGMRTHDGNASVAGYSAGEKASLGGKEVGQGHQALGR